VPGSSQINNRSRETRNSRVVSSRRNVSYDIPGISQTSNSSRDASNIREQLKGRHQHGSHTEASGTLATAKILAAILFSLSQSFCLLNIRYIFAYIIAIKGAGDGGGPKTYASKKSLIFFPLFVPCYPL
jgi:hypothetical protein